MAHFQQITAIVVEGESPYDLRLQMLPEKDQETSNSDTSYTTVNQQVSPNQKNRQYKQIFQSGTQRPPTVQQQVI